MSDKKRLAIISFSHIKGDGRVLRQIEYLSREFEVDVIGYGQQGEEWSQRQGIRFFPVESPTSMGRRLRKAAWLPLGRVFSKAYEAWFWREPEYVDAYEQLLRLSEVDAIHANDWESLPIAARAAKKIKAQVVVDLHEYAPALRENRRYWRLFYKPLILYFLAKHLADTQASVTVNQTIADRYEVEFGITPISVTNAPRYLKKPTFRQTEPEQVQLVHHGNADPDRHLELMIETVALLDERYRLHFMLIDRDKAYLATLRELAKQLAPGRVFFHSPVAPDEVVNRISEFDMGFYLLPTINFNQLAASPNKFFDFIMAGLAVCVGPSIEMARLTKQHGLGLVSESLEPSAVAGLLNQLRAEQIDHFKQNASKTAQILNADTELGKLVYLYNELLGYPTDRAVPQQSIMQS